MPALIASSAICTSLGDGEATFSALLRGESGSSDLHFFDSTKLRVHRSYQINDGGEEKLFRASTRLTECVRQALAESEVDPTRQRVMAVVGTGLRELRTVEKWAVDKFDLHAEQLHFAGAVQRASKHIRDVITLSNACSAGGHALALAQDLIELGDADAVIAAATDTLTESMLVMIGRFNGTPADRVRPFDAGRAGVLLGEGAAAMVVTRADSGNHALARLLSTGLSCDAHHETVPDLAGMQRAMQDALCRANREGRQVDLVVAHGTGTLLNEPLEAELIRRFLPGNGEGARITAVKGAVGHTSGVASLVNVDVAIRCMRTGLIPPICGLNRILPEGDGLPFVLEKPVQASIKLACVNAFGFGGVNAITMVESIA